MRLPSFRSALRVNLEPCLRVPGATLMTDPKAVTCELPQNRQATADLGVGLVDLFRHLVIGGGRLLHR